MRKAKDEYRSSWGNHILNLLLPEFVLLMISRVENRKAELSILLLSLIHMRKGIASSKKKPMRIRKPKSIPFDEVDHFGFVAFAGSGCIFSSCSLMCVSSTI